MPAHTKLLLFAFHVVNKLISTVYVVRSLLFCFMPEITHTWALSLQEVLALLRERRFIWQLFPKVEVWVTLPAVKTALKSV